MNNQIRVLRLLEYTGTHEDLTKHLAQRGVKEISPAGWNCGKVTIRESFIENRLGGWEAPPDPEPKKNASFELAMAHLKRIAVKDTVRAIIRDYALSPTGHEDLRDQGVCQWISQSPVSPRAPRKSRNKTSDLDHPPSAKD